VNPPSAACGCTYECRRKTKCPRALRAYVILRPSEPLDPLKGQDERSLGGPSDPLDLQEPPSEAPQSHRVNPLSSQEEALAGSHPMGLMGHRVLDTPV
jgi:hypothetical protein